MDIIRNRAYILNSLFKGEQGDRIFPKKLLERQKAVAWNLPLPRDSEPLKKDKKKHFW